MSGSVWNGILGFFAYAVLAVAAQNAVFTRALGVSRLVRIVEDGSIELYKFGALLGAVQLISSVLGFCFNRLLAGVALSWKGAVQPLILVLCSTVAFFVVLLTLALAGSKNTARSYLDLLPMATFNCCVLGTLLVAASQNYNLLQSIGFGFGSGVGYLVAVLVVDEGRRRLRSKDIPHIFRGLPSVLIYIGILSLAIYGLVGTVD